MNNLYYTNLNYHPVHQFSTAFDVQQAPPNIVYTNNSYYQPMYHRSNPLPVVYNLEEETIINPNYDASIRPPFHQFSNAIFEEETTRTSFSNYSFYQPPTVSPMIHRPVPLPFIYRCLEETVIIDWIDPSELYNQPTNEEILEYMGQVDYREETAIIEGTDDHWTDLPELYNQPTNEEILEYMGQVDYREETPIIEGTDDRWTDLLELYNQPTNEEILEYMGRVDYREETPIIGEAYDYSTFTNQLTYEENLELEERLGRVGSRLSEESIMGHLKITSYDATSKRMDEEADICVICQDEYEKDELIGGLQCRHEYHVECIKRWLQQQKWCPICKADAVSPNGNKF